MLPDHYESTLYLPFNHHSLKGNFEFQTPDADTGAAGVWLILHGGRLLLDGETGCLPLVLPSEATNAPLYIGLWQGSPCRVLTLSRSLPCPVGLICVDLLAEQPQLSITMLSLAMLGRQMVRWGQNSQYCSSCAAVMDYLPGEWGRQCSGCGRQHYPHIHPCIIVLIKRGNELLLTRKANWVAGRYGLVAGFVEPGECLEETVVREVMEETAIAVKNIRYVGSQSWPFPSQIMTGFVADYAGGEIQVETKELEDARWFSRDELPLLPARRSIARFLLDHHL
ncbi:MAG: NAD(+) diphosphatase [Thermodesulfobacteriota bacterium]|nr:NAD(+) diphosphatase [Thermodesulfobacteriota bacterium]